MFEIPLIEKEVEGVILFYNIRNSKKAFSNTMLKSVSRLVN